MGIGVLAVDDTTASGGQDPPPAPHFPAWLLEAETLKGDGTMTMRCSPLSQLGPLFWSCLQQNQATFSGFLLVSVEWNYSGSPSFPKDHCCPKFGKHSWGSSG